MRFAHTNIVSTDWKRLVRFYENTFNCVQVPPIRRQSGAWLDRGTGLKNASLEGAHLLLPGHGKNGPTLEIYQYDHIIQQETVPPNKRGFGHIAFEVDDVEVILNSVIENGGKTLGEITKREVAGIGEITFVYARDPEGNILELQCWKKK
ncbi:MAG: VOC family protein [Maribacter sp.]